MEQHQRKYDMKNIILIMKHVRSTLRTTRDSQGLYRGEGMGAQIGKQQDGKQQQ